MRRGAQRWALSSALSLALCAATGAQQALAAEVRKGDAAADSADAPAEAPKVAPFIANVREVAADPAGVWTRFFAGADLESAYDQYGVLDGIDIGEQSADAAQCREAASKLKTAVEAVPVSIALHRAAMLCADAVGDKAAAGREADALASLARFALADGAGSRWRPPIRVLSPRDVDGVLSLLGYEARYTYFLNAQADRYFPVVIAAWDARAKQEQHLAFDYVDAAFRIDRGDTYSGLPFERSVLVSSFLAGQLKNSEPSALDIQAVRDAFLTDNADERMKTLREAAARGGQQSAMQWMKLCADAPAPDCADGLVDALLPLAEKRQARAMVLLAAAYADGIGIEADPKAAAILLDAADRQWRGQGASIMFSGLQLLLKAHLDEFTLDRLRRLSANGNASAAFMLAVDALDKDPRRELTPKEIAILQRPLFNGNGAGHAQLYNYYLRRSMPAERDAALRAASDAGLAEVQRMRAYGIIQDEGLETAKPRWLPLMEAAAHGGDAPAARMMSAVARDRQAWREAAGWLLGAAARGDVPALYQLASMYEEGHEGVSGTLDDAIGAYEDIAADASDTETAPKARRRLAALAIEGRGMKRNPRRAREWLLFDAEKGDVASQLQLAGAYLDGSFGQADTVEGERWLARAADNGSVEGRTAYGSWLVSRRGSADAHARGVALLRMAAKDGGLKQLNELTWFQCVSPSPETRDPAAGLDGARRMQRMEARLSAGYLDTVAACYAANGDFAAAARLQQQAVDGAPADGASAEVMRDRLALYKAGKAYVQALQ